MAIVACAMWLPTAQAFAQGNVAPVDPEIQQARQSFDAVNFEAVRDALTPLIARLSQTDVNEGQRRVLAAAYELRGRALLNLRDQDGARADFKSMLMLDPSYPFPPEAGSRAAALFEEVRAATVGTIDVAVTPADAEVQIDGRVMTDRPLRVALVSGFHSIKASRRGHASLQQQFEVRPGESTTLPLALVRELTTLTLRTIPASVTVLVDGAPRGMTQADPAATPAAESADTPSQPFVIEDLPNGAHRLELRRDCFVTDQRQLDLQRPEDLRLDVVRLTPAVGSINVRSQSGGTLFVDDKERGTVPQVVEECQGPHVFEVRTRTGRDIRRIDIKTGSKDEFDAAVRPAFAIVADTTTAGGGDGRLRAETALNGARSMMFFAAAKSRVDNVAAETRVPADWLAVDAAGRPGNVALTAAARRAAGLRFAEVLETQGVAAIGQDGTGDPRAMVLTLLAPGSTRPDVLRWRADDAASVRQLLARVDAVPVLTRRSLGMLALDVLDVQGVVVGSVEADGGAAVAGLQPGDVITAAAGQPLTGVASLLMAVAGASGPQISLDVRDRSGAVRKVDVTVQTVPHVTPPSDETVLANARAVALTARLAAPATAVDAASLHLNLASAWMRLENWDAAVRELTAVETLANGSQLPANVKEAVVGNAQYLLGLCAARTGNAGAAEQAWTKAAGSSGRLLSESGEPLKELAEQRLAELRNQPAPR